MRAPINVRVVAAVIGVGLFQCAGVCVAQTASDDRSVVTHHPSLEDARRSFYTGRYDAAATLTLELRTAAPELLAAYELRTSALLFQLKAALGDQRDKEKAFKACQMCPELLAASTTQLEARRSRAPDFAPTPKMRKRSSSSASSI